jgi:chromosome partitioning protein
MGLLTLNGLTAAGSVIIPVQAEYLALEGLAEIFNTIELVQQRLNPELRILGLVMTMFDSRTRLAIDVVKDVHRLNPRRMFNALIPRSIRLAEAPSHGMSIFEYDPGSRGAEAYRLLGAEVVQRLAGQSVGQPVSLSGDQDRRTA